MKKVITNEVDAEQRHAEHDGAEELDRVAELAVRGHLVGLLQALDEIGELEAGGGQLHLLARIGARRIGVQRRQRRQCAKACARARIRLHEELLVLAEGDHAALVVQQAHGGLERAREHMVHRQLGAVHPLLGDRLAARRRHKEARRVLVRRLVGHVQVHGYLELAVVHVPAGIATGATASRVLVVLVTGVGVSSRVLASSTVVVDVEVDDTIAAFARSPRPSRPLKVMVRVIIIIIIIIMCGLSYMLNWSPGGD